MLKIKKYIFPTLIILASLYLLIIVLALQFEVAFLFLSIILGCAIYAIVFTKSNKLNIEKYFISRIFFLILTAASAFLAIKLFSVEKFYAYMTSIISLLIRVAYVLIFTKTAEEKKALLLAEPQIFVSGIVFSFLYLMENF